jgi:hypothetical protein
MLRDADALEHYHIVRFEDVLRDPIGVTRSLYRHAGLNFDEVEQIRLQMKPTMTRSGEHRLDRGYDRPVVWYAKDAIASHFHAEIDEVQVERLSAADRGAFLKIAGDAMEKLGYL